MHSKFLPSMHKTIVPTGAVKLWQSQSRAEDIRIISTTVFLIRKALFLSDHLYAFLPVLKERKRHPTALTFKNGFLSLLHRQTEDLTRLVSCNTNV